jgi:DNA-binding XRE family transcriptional regulator
MPTRDATALLRKLGEFAEDPFAGHAGALPLAGQPNRARIRQGDWRAVVLIVRAENAVIVARRAQERSIPMTDATDTVTLTRAEYEALIRRLEDAEDNAVIDRLEARLQAEGFAAATGDYLPIELVERLLAGEHPVRVWRAHRGLTREALAAAAGVSPSYVTEIETRRKPGSFDAMIKLAGALKVPLDDIAAWLKPAE